MAIEVLVTTMHQTNLNLYKQMNLQTSAVIANQTSNFNYQEENINGNCVKMISTSTRGLSRNRNIALALSTLDYILFADDDLKFIDGYNDLILDEIKKHPEADAIKFNLYNLSKSRKIGMQPINKFEKATIFNMGGSGVCGIVIKKASLVKANITFHENFGTGTSNYCGEDTIFIYNLIKKGIKLYRSPIVIAGIDQTESTWFEGFNEKYFVVSGMVFKEMNPFLAPLIAIRSSYKFSKRENCNMSFSEILRSYYKGIFTNE